jgi:hypothetical protein
MLALIVVAGLSPACTHKPVEAPEAAPRTANEEAVIADFKTRLDKYEAISGKLRAEVFPASSEVQASEIHRHQKELAARIKQALPDWKQGDIFTPGINTIFKRRLAEALSGTDGANNRGAIFDDAPPTQTVVVLTEYPTGMPVATVPAEILQLLPVLPKELEYRFIGRHLILFDVSAYLMVDVIPDAIK